MGNPHPPSLQIRPLCSNNRPMNNDEITPKQALEVLQNLGALDSLKLNLKEHHAVQSALKVISELVNKEQPQVTEVK